MCGNAITRHCTRKQESNCPTILEAEINQQVTDLYLLGPGAFMLGDTLMTQSLSELIKLSHAYKTHWVPLANITKAQHD